MKTPAFFGTLAGLVLALASCQPETATKPRPPAPVPLTTLAQVDSATHRVISVQRIPTAGQPASMPSQEAEVLRKAREAFGDSTIVFHDPKPR